MLKIKNLHSYYGAIEALKGINIDIEAGKITCLIGSNGAGKTTLLKAISNMIQSTGEIMYEEENLLRMSPQKICKKGIVHVPESRHIFSGLSVESNLEVGTVNWHGFFGKQSYKEDIEMVFKLFPRLEERREQLGWSLSGGEQQMLAIGRAMMARPKLLLLDEPSMGLAPVVVKDLFEKIVEINKKEGIPILLVEQNAKLALEVSDHAYVINQGKVVISGDPSELKNSTAIVQSYLGKFARDDRSNKGAGV